MELNLLDIFILICLSQGFLLGCMLIFVQRFSSNGNHFLGYTVILISIIQLDTWLTALGFAEKYFFVDFLGDDVPWILLVYVPLFLFFLHKTKHSLVNHRCLFLLGLPFLIFLVLNILIDLELDFQLYHWPALIERMEIIYFWEELIAILLSLSLCAASYYIIQRNIDTQLDSKWLRHIWGFTLVLCLYWALVFSLPAHFDPLIYVLWLGLLSFIFWLTYQGVCQYKFSQLSSRWALEQTPPTDYLSSTAASSLPSYEKGQSKGLSNASPAKSKAGEQAYFDTLERLMKNEQLYLDPQLSLQKVADQLGISAGYLSQIVNVATQQNFNSYVNRFRVARIKEMLVDSDFDHYNLLGIGQEAGFSAKSTFYASFKKETGMTPSQYRKQLK